MHRNNHKWNTPMKLLNVLRLNVVPVKMQQNTLKSTLRHKVFNSRNNFYNHEYIKSLIECQEPVVAWFLQSQGIPCSLLNSSYICLRVGEFVNTVRFSRKIIWKSITYLKMEELFITVSKLCILKLIGNLCKKDLSIV